MAYLYDSAEVEAARDQLAGRIVYQRLGAVVGDVRLDRDGNYVVSGACTVDDVSKVDAQWQAEVQLIKQKIVTLDPKPIEPLEGEAVVP